MPILLWASTKPSCPDYFTKLLEDDLKAVVKPQYVDQIPKAVRAPASERSVEHLLTSRLSMDNMKEVCDTLGMCHIPNCLQCLLCCD